MTTITIKNGQKQFTKTSFDTVKELFVYLREKLSPVSIYLVDDSDIPESINKSIEKAAREGEGDTIDFKG